MKSTLSVSLLVGMACAQSAAVTPARTQTVVDLFLGAKRPGNYSFDGRVITADSTATTYEIVCKSGALNLPGFPTTTCDLRDPPWTVTNGPSLMIGVLSTAIANVTALLQETCTVEDRTAAYCNYTFAESIGGTSTSTSYTTVITGDNYYEYPVAITAGTENLPLATTTSESASPTPTSGSFRSTLDMMMLLVLAGIIGIWIGY
ncbi:hypothetical protein PFICI_11978 [Pestalotiopsis fici W106-1]|uniref:Ig-like domain-containing protein n=1 Tax=Pestalotiopsis fici (strain W106-1 / CGMCC3.15140) TaxID=1229662 RepID=W3WUP9_PESFW|nr:uncharacterized protein PFICI_11978 [Pestalotiopsis fici W106-1]ETS76591.1 hypothetical protein PFICI_11978 [Pestalotiopsis fici W106-1]